MSYEGDINVLEIIEAVDLDVMSIEVGDVEMKCEYPLTKYYFSTACDIDNVSLKEEYLSDDNTESHCSSTVEETLKSDQYNFVARHDLINLKAHIKNLQGSDNFKSGQCDFITKDKHVNPGKGSFAATNLKNEFITHSKSNKLKCELCSFTTKYKSSLTQHMKIKHGSTKFRCRQCEYVGNRKTNLTHHILVQHGSNDIQFECKQCDFTTRCEIQLKSHVRIYHDTNKFKCEQCDFVTEYKRSLTSHVNSSHSSKEFKCRWCKYITKNRTNLIKHLKFRHTSRTTSSVSSATSSPSTRTSSVGM